jgi:hypothetical protein
MSCSSERHAERIYVGPIVLCSLGSIVAALASDAITIVKVRTHVSLGKDAPCRRPIERFGDIVSYPILGGLDHRYARI